LRVKVSAEMQANTKRGDSFTGKPLALGIGELQWAGSCGPRQCAPVSSQPTFFYGG
jgi:hypothetical protein